MAWRAPAGAPTREPASAWRWCKSWPTCTADRLRRRARWAPAAPGGVDSAGNRPFAGSPPSSRTLAYRPRRSALSPTSKKRCAGCRAARIASARLSRSTTSFFLSRRCSLPPMASGQQCWLSTTMPTCGEYITRLLGAAHYQVRTTAQTGRKRSLQFDSSVPDLLLSDVVIPRLDGLGLVRQIRADATLADIPIVLYCHPRRRGIPASKAWRLAPMTTFETV